MELLVLTFFVWLGLSVFSGMAGGGGGFIAIPYFIALGMPPAVALATARFGGLGTAFGSITAFTGKGLIDRKYMWAFMAICFVTAVIASFIIPQIDADIFKKVIGALLLVMIPTLFIQNQALQPGSRSQRWIFAGFVLFTLVSFLQGLFGTGLAVILNLILMFLFGMDALRAAATKRVAQMVLTAVSCALLAFQGLVVWSYGLVALVGAIIGTYIGTRIAIKKGTHFVKLMLAAFMALSGVALLFS
jgi:uncharacterized protein